MNCASFSIICVLFSVVVTDDRNDEITSSLLPDGSTCGKNAQDRIVGGTLAALDEFPWMALLEYDRPTMRFRCGGSLINNRYVLTAAHCVSKYLVSVRLGEYDLASKKDCEDETPGFEDCSDEPLNIPVEDKIVHKAYLDDNPDLHNDIALLRLSKKVTFTKYIKPICLPVSFNLRTFGGTIMTVAGWGKTEGGTTSNIKMKLEVPVKLISECSPMYRMYNKTLNENQICAGGVDGKDSCMGDSGGPLMFTSSTEDNWYIAGVVSYGPHPCGLKGWPSIYTRVPKYVQWIVDNLKP